MPYKVGYGPEWPYLIIPNKTLFFSLSKRGGPKPYFQRERGTSGLSTFKSFSLEKILSPMK